MSVVELSDEENVAVLAETFTESLSNAGDPTRQRAVLKRLYELLASSTPQHYIYETVAGCDELQVIRVGGDQRIFCRLVMGIPQGNKRYNVLFVFYVDPHRYRSGRLAVFDEAAAQRFDEITSFEGAHAGDDYLEARNTFGCRDPGPDRSTRRVARRRTSSANVDRPRRQRDAARRTPHKSAGVASVP